VIDYVATTELISHRLETEMRPKIIILLALAFALVAGACSGETFDSGVASLDGGNVAAQAQDGTADSASDEEAVIAFTACLRDEGLDVEDPTVDDQGNLRPPRLRDVADVDREMADAAFAACAPHLEGVTFGLDSEDRTEREDSLLAFAACARENGYDMPDPDFSHAGVPGAGGGGPFANIDKDDPAFQAALKACSDVFGPDSPIPGTGGGRS
jgi:hypothetical protein